MIRRFIVLAIAGLSLLVISAGIAAGHGDQRNKAKAVLHDVNGARVGVVKLTQVRGTVRVRVQIDGLAAGFHGFHVHDVGDCTPPFTSALGHFNPAATGHPGHAADMPVLLVNANGTAETQFSSDRYRLADVIGRALIVHAGPDNYANIPTRYAAGGPDATTLGTGDAGARAACGVIKKTGN